MMKRMGSDSLKKLEMIALVKVYVKCRNDLGFVWSKVARIPHKDPITVCLSLKEVEKLRSIREQKPRALLVYQWSISATRVRPVWSTGKGPQADTLWQIGSVSLAFHNTGFVATLPCPCPIDGEHISLHIIFTARLCAMFSLLTLPSQIVRQIFYTCSYTCGSDVL